MSITTEAAQQWYCCRWRGHGDILTKASGDDRRSDRTALPPFETKAWLDKPSELRPKLASGVEDALSWLESELDKVGPELREDGGWERYKGYLPSVKQRLGIGRDVTWGLWLKDGAHVVLALVAPIREQQGQP